MEKETISLVLSIFAAIGASYTYVVHTRRLNSQQRQINDYQLRQLKEEEENKKKAFIECALIQKPSEVFNTLDYIQLTNKGKATAYNIALEVDKQKISLHVADGVLPLPELHPGQSFEMLYYKNSNDYHYKIVVIWDDEFKKGEKAERVLNL